MSSRWLVAVALAVALVIPEFAALAISTASIHAHPGHDETSVILGTVKKVTDVGIELQALDQESMQMINAWIVTDRETEYRNGKKRLETRDKVLMPGRRVQVLARSEDDADGSIRLRALEIQVKDSKK